MSGFYSSNGGRSRGRSGYYRGSRGGGFYEGGGSRFYKERRDYGGSGGGATGGVSQLEIAKKLVDTLMSSRGEDRRSSGGSEYFGSSGGGSSYKRPRNDDSFERYESRRHSEGYYRRTSDDLDVSGEYQHRHSTGGGRSYRARGSGSYRSPRGYTRGGSYSYTRGRGYRHDAGDSSYRSKPYNNYGQHNRTFSGPTPKNFMTLRCPHCKIRCNTFAAYKQHQLGQDHMTAMRRIVTRVRTEVTRMRLAQREQQTELEKAQAEKDIDYDTKEPEHCLICKLNYREVDGVVHEQTEWHKKQKAYQNPSCALCGTSYPTRISYEKHLGSLNHMQKQHQVDKAADKSAAAAFTQGDMMTLDEVGDVDIAEDNGDGTAEPGQPKTSATQKLTELAEFDGKHALGSNYMRKTEVYHCALCDTYIKITAKINAVLIKHCMSKKHYENYRKKLQWLSEKEAEEAAAAAKKQEEEEDQLKPEDDEKDGDDVADGATNGDTTRRVVRKTEEASWEQMDDNFLLGDEQDDKEDE